MTILRYGGILVFTSKWWAYQNTKALLTEVKIMDFAIIFASVCMRDRNLKSFIVLEKLWQAGRSHIQYAGATLATMGSMKWDFQQLVTASLTSSAPLPLINYHTLLRTAPILQRESQKEERREEVEDEQRLPRRAWSCNCEKRLLHYLHRTPQTEEGFYLSVLWDQKRQQKVIS